MKPSTTKSPAEAAVSQASDSGPQRPARHEPVEPLGPEETPEPGVVEVPEPGIVDVPEPTATSLGLDGEPARRELELG
jgi:hypothetical protein